MRPTHLFAATALSAVALIAAASAFAQNAGGISTQIPVGGRAEGMGRAYTAIADDATATWWNPAGLGFLPGNQIALMHTQLVPGLANDVYFEYLAYTHQYQGWGSVGISAAYLTYGTSPAIDEQGNQYGEFKSYEVVPELTYGTRLTPNVAVGVGLKYISVNLAPAWATGTGQPGNGKTFAADFGTLIHVPLAEERSFLPSASFAVVLDNLGPNIAFIQEDQSDPIARELKLGAAATLYDAEPFKATFAFDLTEPLVEYKFPASFHDHVLLGTGVEVAYRNLIAARIGYVDDSVGTIQDTAYGVGISPIRGVRFDYANVPQSKYIRDSRVSKFSLTASF
jgi:hypothetical protein